MQRRDFLRYLGVGTAGLLVPPHLVADDDRRRGSRQTAAAPSIPTNMGVSGNVVVVGGGMAGATVAKYLRLWGGTGIKVTLVEPNTTYYSCILSNLVLNGTRRMQQLAFDYQDLVKHYGIDFVSQAVINIDPVAQQVVLNNGNKLHYDRLVIAPGIAFDTLSGLESAQAQQQVLHAWKAGAQTQNLYRQIRAMRDKDTFILTIPKAPYRCPPGPYERACIVADYLKRRKRKARVMVLDANAGITAERENFTHAFERIHGDVITYVPNAQIDSIDAQQGSVNTRAGRFQGSVINAIPPHRAGGVITANSLANVAGKWAGVDVLSYESTAAANVHVIGDAAATTQPKAGHIANAEAKVCADAIIRLLRGGSPDSAPMTNSSCYTPITHNTASWLSVVYRYDPFTGTMKPTGSGVTEASTISRENFKEMLKWFDNLMTDTFA